jgi:hypothetical protein
MTPNTKSVSANPKYHRKRTSARKDNNEKPKEQRKHADQMSTAITPRRAITHQ